MNTSDSLALSCYQQIAVLDKEHEVTLVQHNTTGSIYVRKRLSVYNIDVYRYLLDHHIRGIPAIEEIACQDNNLIVIEEYISGRTLQAVLDNGNLFPAADAVRIVRQLCLILREMHLAEPGSAPKPSPAFAPAAPPIWPLPSSATRSCFTLASH